MFENLGKTYLNFLQHWTAAVRRHAFGVVALGLVFSIVSVLYLVHNIRINTSTTDMLSAELPFRQKDREMSAAFPEMSDNLLIVIDGHTPDLADRAALALAEKMRLEPKVFGTVIDIAGEPYFRTNGLLYLDIDELYELSDRLAEAQPFLGALWRDLSLRGLFGLFGKAIDVVVANGANRLNDVVVANGANDASASEAIAPPIEIARMLNAVAAVGEAQISGAFSELSWRELMQGKDDGANANRRFLLIRPTLDFLSLSPASDAMEAVRALSLKMALVPENGVRVRLTGSAALDEEELESVEQGMGLAGLLSLCLVTFLLVVGLKRLSLVLATVLTLVMGLIWTAAFAVLALGSLNLISVAFAVLFIGLSVDFGIHYGLRYKEAVDDGADHEAGLQSAAKGAGGALTLSAIAAAMAFYSFLPTDYRGLAELGLIAGTGMFIALFANMTLLPALLTCLPRVTADVKNNERSDTTDQRPSAFGTLIQTRARLICIVFALLGGGALVLAPRVDFDFDPLNLKNPSTESMATLIDLMADSRTSPYSIEILSPDLNQAETLAAQLRKLDGVASAETLADYVPVDQDEKLDVIATTSLFLSPALSGSGKRVELDDKTQRAALTVFADKLKLLSKKGSPTDREAAGRLAKVLAEIAASGDTALVELDNRLLNALPAQLKGLKQSLGASPVSLADLPKSVTARQIAADGRTRIEVYPKENLQDRAALIRFVDTVRTVSLDAIGSPVIILEAGRAVLRSFYQAGALSVVLIAVMLVVVLGRLRDVLLVFAPLMLAGLFSLALSVILGLSFNFANVIVLPLLFGLGVAGGIHLVSRDAGGGGQVMETSTPRAVVFSALTTIGSFGSIALSSHPGTSSMGVLLTLTISLTLLCTLVFLPALMTVTSGGQRDGR
jgi:uncharacterized protein